MVEKIVRIPYGYAHIPACCYAFMSYCGHSLRMRFYTGRFMEDPQGWSHTLFARPTPAFSGAAGDLHRSAQALARHHASRSRLAQGPRQRRPLQSNVGRPCYTDMVYAY